MLMQLSSVIRGRQRHLLNEYYQNRLDTKDDIHQIRRTALAVYLRKNLPDVPPETPPGAIHSSIAHKYGGLLEKGPFISDQEAKTLMYIKTLQAAANAMNAIEANTQGSQQDLENLDDILMNHFDILYGSSVDSTDLAIWTRLTKQYEERFFEDMRAMNVLDPNIVCTFQRGSFIFTEEFRSPASLSMVRR